MHLSSKCIFHSRVRSRSGVTNKPVLYVVLELAAPPLQNVGIKMAE